MLKNSDAYEYLLSKDGMNALHERLILENEWFFHETEIRNLKSIQTSRLEPRARTDTIYTPSCKSKSLTVETEILCVRPNKSKVRWKGVVGSCPTISLAINKTHVPKHIGLDFTFPQHWNALDDNLSSGKCSEVIDAALDTVYSYGVIVFFTGVQPENIRVQIDEATTPENWPALRDFDLSQLKL